MGGRSSAASLGCAGFGVFRRYSDPRYKTECFPLLPYKTGLSLASDISCTPFVESIPLISPSPSNPPSRQTLLLIISQRPSRFWFLATPNVFFPPFDGGPYARSECAAFDLILNPLSLQI